MKTARKLHEEIQNHIHSELCSEVNNMLIRIKLNHDPYIALESVDQQNKIIEARSRHPEPQWEEMIDLLTRIRDEMNECKQPYRRY